MSPSRWATARFGAAAGELMLLVPRALAAAHEYALQAHIASGLKSNDAYGHTLKVQQYQQLAEHVGSVTGVSIRRPGGIGGRFEYVVFEETAVVLVPWRYASDRRKSYEKARLRTPVSDLNKTLLGFGQSIDLQYSFDQLERDPDELAAEQAEEVAVVEQLSAFGRVVTVGYASNPGSGVSGMVWGDVELIDAQTGDVAWHDAEPLYLVPAVNRQEPGSESVVKAVASTTAPSAVRFDDADPEEDFGLTLRSPLSEAPISEPERLLDEAGDDDDRGR